MQAMQWVQLLLQTGRLFCSVMLFIGQRSAHWPQPTQASEAVKAFALTKQE